MTKYVLLKISQESTITVPAPIMDALEKELQKLELKHISRIEPSLEYKPHKIVCKALTHDFRL